MLQKRYNDPIFEFQWRRYSDYQLLDYSGVPYIVGTGDITVFTPMKERPDLHKVFANEVKDKASVLEFVKNWGHLGHGIKPPNRSEHMEKVDNILQASRNISEIIEIVSDPKRMPDKMTLALFFNKSLSPAMTIKILPIENAQSDFAIKVFPTTLVSYMMLRIAKEITEGVEWRLCQMCNEPFHVLINDRRTQQGKFCSSKCRTAFCRAKDRDNK